MNVANVITGRFWKWKNTIGRILDDHDGYMTVDDLYMQCCSCQKLFFDNDEAFVVVNVVELPKDTYLHITLAGGTMKGLDELDTIIHKFGQQIGATKATMIGRKGFSRALKRRGWKERFVYMEKEIL